MVCESCKAPFSVEEVVNQLHEEVATKDNYFDTLTPANCANCGGYHPVNRWKDVYVCLACIQCSDEIEQCEWCGEGNNGSVEGSAIFGCSSCDGNTKLLAD